MCQANLLDTKWQVSKADFWNSSFSCSKQKETKKDYWVEIASLSEIIAGLGNAFRLNHTKTSS
jgi:hypothetical protein